MSGIGAASSASQVNPFTALTAKPKAVALSAARDSDGDNDGSRPGEVEAGKGATIDKLA